jgi:very-short-patch-repair endonuclease
MKGYENAPSGSVDRARWLRQNSTEAEKLLWRKLREAFPRARFRRQSLMTPYYPDFLSFRYKLIVEVDGGQHAEAVDARRTRFLEAKGYRVIRFWNNEVLSNPEGVLQTISQVLQEQGMG